MSTIRPDSKKSAMFSLKLFMKSAYNWTGVLPWNRGWSSTPMLRYSWFLAPLALV
jgi:hypothetical protein